MKADIQHGICTHDLEASVKKDILEKGYSEVYEGQFVAYVGHHGLPGGNHLHFEVRKDDIRNILDPYGWGDYGPMWRDAENPELREPVVISGLKILDKPPYKKGMTITANFEILNKSNEDIEIEIITVGGRDPNDQIADFTWHENFTFHKGETYSYYGFIFLEKHGKYHFFVAYKPKNKDWNPSIPVDNEGINNILNIYVYPSHGGGGEF